MLQSKVSLIFLFQILIKHFFDHTFQATKGKNRVLFIGITCGLSAPYVAGQLWHCMENLDVFTPVLLGFNPTGLARYVIVLRSCIFLI